MVIRPSNTSKGMLADGIWRGSTVSPRMLTRGKVVRGRNARGDAPLRRILDQALQMDDIVALKPSVHVGRTGIAVVAMEVDRPVCVYIERRPTR